MLGAHRSQRPLIFNMGDMKLGDLTKLWLFKLIVTKSNFKKSVMTSSPIRQPNDVPKFFHFGLPPQSKFLATPVPAVEHINLHHQKGAYKL